MFYNFTFFGFLVHYAQNSTEFHARSIHAGFDTTMYGISTTRKPLTRALVTLPQSELKRVQENYRFIFQRGLIHILPEHLGAGHYKTAALAVLNKSKEDSTKSKNE